MSGQLLRMDDTIKDNTEKHVKIGMWDAVKTTAGMGPSMKNKDFQKKKKIFKK